MSGEPSRPAAVHQGERTILDHEHGLWIPTHLRAAESGTIRTPAATITEVDLSNRYCARVDAALFGPTDGFGDPAHPELAPNQVRIEPLDDPAIEMAVEIHPDLHPDGGDPMGERPMYVHVEFTDADRLDRIHDAKTQIDASWKQMLLLGAQFARVLDDRDYEVAIQESDHIALVQPSET